jgi:hypothetical protein
MDPKPVATPADYLTRPEMTSPPLVAHPLPSLGEVVEYEGHRYVIRDLTVTTRIYSNPGQGGDRVSLNLRLVAWEGEAPYTDPANDSMF